MFEIPLKIATDELNLTEILETKKKAKKQVEFFERKNSHIKWYVKVVRDLRKIVEKGIYKKLLLYTFLIQRGSSLAQE